MQPREGLVPARRAGEGEEPSVRGGEGRPRLGRGWISKFLATADSLN